MNRRNMLAISATTVFALALLAGGAIGSPKAQIKKSFPVHRSARRRPAPLSVGKQSRRAEHGEEREDDAQRQPNLPL